MGAATPAIPLFHEPSAIAQPCSRTNVSSARSSRSAALLKAGRPEPASHAVSRPKLVEREATYRAIALAELVDQPIHIFHVSCGEVAEEIARAQARGVKVTGETCPQYLVLTAAPCRRP